MKSRPRWSDNSLKDLAYKHAEVPQLTHSLDLRLLFVAISPLANFYIVPLQIIQFCLIYITHTASLGGSSIRSFMSSSSFTDHFCIQNAYNLLSYTWNVILVSEFEACQQLRVEAPDCSTRGVQPLEQVQHTADAHRCRRDWEADEEAGRVLRCTSRVLFGLWRYGEAIPRSLTL